MAWRRDSHLPPVSAGRRGQTRFLACPGIPARPDGEWHWLREYRSASVSRLDWTKCSCDITRWVCPGTRTKLQRLVSRQGPGGAEIQLPLYGGRAEAVGGSHQGDCR